jgi:hypothetical protein
LIGKWNKTLQDELECSRATVNRIIQEMRLYFNAPIEYDRSRNGYHYALSDGQTFELPGLWFSETELYALLTTQQLLAHVQPGLLDTQLKPVKERIEQILVTRHLGDVKLLSGHPSEEISKRVRILRMTGRNVALECFQTVAGALLQRNSLRINYHGRGNDQTSQREISPQRLIHYRDKTAQAFLRRRLMRRMPRYAGATTGIWTLTAIPATPCAASPSNASPLPKHCHSVAATYRKNSSMRITPVPTASSRKNPSTPPCCASPRNGHVG